MSIFYRFPSSTYLGKYIKCYTDIDNISKSEIRFHLSVSLFVPENSKEAFENDIKKYRSYLSSRFFSSKAFFSKLKNKLPDGYYMEPSRCFKWKNEDLDNIRQFEKLYSGVEMIITVSAGRKLENILNTPHVHSEAIMEIFNALDNLFETVQNQSRYQLMFIANNMGKMRNTNKMALLNSVALTYKYLLKEENV